MKDEYLKLDNQLCFAIYASSREIIKLYRPLLEEFDLTYTQYITLLVLWETDHISVKDLGDKLYLDSGTLTPLLKKLESMALIKRVRSLDDERNLVISLTQKGIELKGAVSHIPEKLICTTSLPLQDVVDLRQRLKVLLDHIQAVK